MFTFFFIFYSFSTLSNNLFVRTNNWSSRFWEFILLLYGDKINLRPENRNLTLT